MVNKQGFSQDDDNGRGRKRNLQAVIQTPGLSTYGGTWPIIIIFGSLLQVVRDDAESTWRGCCTEDVNAEYVVNLEII